MMMMIDDNDGIGRVLVREESSNAFPHPPLLPATAITVIWQLTPIIILIMPVPVLVVLIIMHACCCQSCTTCSYYWWCGGNIECKTINWTMDYNKLTATNNRNSEYTKRKNWESHWTTRHRIYRHTTRRLYFIDKEIKK